MNSPPQPAAAAAKITAKTPAKIAAATAVAPPPPPAVMSGRGFIGATALIGAVLLLAAGAASAQTLTLTGPAALAERDADTTAAYTVTRSGAEFTERTEFAIALQTSEDTSRATASVADIAAAQATVVFAAGQDSATFNVIVRGDNLNEADEVFRLQVGSGIGSTERIRVLIADDDRIAAVVSAPATVAEGEDAVITVDLGAIPTGDITLTYAILTTDRRVSDVGAAFAYDRTGRAADLTHAAGGAITAQNIDFVAAAAAATSVFRIVFAVVDDAINESAEVFRFALDAGRISGGHGAPIVSRGITNYITIAASDPAALSLARAPGQAAAVNEGQVARFAVTLSAASAAAVTVPYTVDAGGGYSPTDLGGGSISIAAGATEGIISIGMPLDGDLDSGDQTVTVTLGASPTAARGGGTVARASTVADQSAQVTVNFLDTAHAFTFSDPATAIAEGAAATTYTVARAGPAIASGGSITVTWAYAAATPAPAAADFSSGAAPAGGTLVFTGADASKTFPIATAADTANEPDEQFTLTLSIASGDQTAADAAGGASLPPALSVAIADDDPVTVEITRASGTGAVAESAGALSFTVTVAGGTRAAGVSTVVPFTIGGAGITAGDYDITAPTGIAMSATGGSVTIAQSASTATITVTITNDELNEAQEMLTVTGAAAGSSGLRLTETTAGTAGGVEYADGGDAASVGITDNDDISISITADAPTATEGGSAAFTVHLSHASTAEVRVLVDNDSGVFPTAVHTVTFPVGENGVTATTAPLVFDIPNRPDLGAGDERTLRVFIFESGHSAAGSIYRSATARAAEVTVSYTDAAHAFSLTSPATSITETDADADATLTFTLARAGPAITGAGLSVTWAVAAGSATAADFTGGNLPGGAVTFSGSQTSRAFTISIAGDNLNEAGETFTVNFSIAAGDAAAFDANGGATLPGNHAATIADDDAIALTASAASAGVSEGGSAVLNLNLGAVPTSGITVNYALSNSVDVTDAGGGSIAFTAAAGLATGRIELGITADNLNEAAEQFTVTITAADISGAHGDATVAGGGVTTFTIAASDPITARLARATGESGGIVEGGMANFTVTLTDAAGAALASAGPIDIAYLITGPPDATPAAGSRALTIRAGATSGAIVVGVPSSNRRDSGSETLTVALSTITAGAGAGRVESAAGAGVSVTVTHQAAARTLTVTGPATIAEGDAGVESAAYTITLSGRAFAAATEVTWTVTHGTTAAADFVAAADRSGTVMFGAGDTSQTFTLTIAGDNLNEATERFTVQASVVNTALDGGTGFGAAHATAIADDDTITATISGSGTVNEGGNASVTVALSGGDATAPVVITYAPAGADTRAATLSIPVGTASGTLTIPIAADGVNEGAEMFTVAARLTAASAGAVTIAGSAAVTIAASDAISVSVARVAETVTVGGTAAFTVTMSGASMADVTVYYDLAGAVTAMDETLTIAAGRRSGAIEVAIPADALDSAGSGSGGSDSAMLTVTLTGANAATGGGTAAVADAPGNSASVTVVPAPTSTAEELHEMVLPEVARAVVGRQMSAIAGRAGAAGAAGNLAGFNFNLNGQTTLAGVAAANAKTFADNDGNLDAKSLLRDLEFVMPLAAGDGDAAGGRAIAFWGGADYQNFSGEDGDAEWDGDLLSAHLGVDGKVRDNLLAGVMVSYSDSSSDYKQPGGNGEYELDATSVSPYLNWRFANGAAWVSVSYGSGEVEVKPDGADATSNDVDMRSAAAGGSRRLLRDGGRELFVRGDVFSARTEIEGAGAGAAGIAEDLGVDANRVRLALELRQSRELAGGAAVAGGLDFGARYDGGDGRGGAGMELGARLRYHDAARGLTLQARARGLLAHDDGNGGWGVGGLARLAAGADGQGLALSVTPSYGAGVDSYGDSGVDSLGLWDNDLAAAASADDLSARLNAEIGYGLPAAGLGFGDGLGLGDFSGGMLTPYTAMRLGESSRDYRFGMRWSAADRLDLDLSARRLDTANAADNRVTLEGRLRF